MSSFTHSDQEQGAQSLPNYPPGRHQQLLQMDNVHMLSTVCPAVWKPNPGAWGEHTIMYPFSNPAGTPKCSQS